MQSIPCYLYVEYLYFDLVNNKLHTRTILHRRFNNCEMCWSHYQWHTVPRLLADNEETPNSKQSMRLRQSCSQIKYIKMNVKVTKWRDFITKIAVIRAKKLTIQNKQNILHSDSCRQEVSFP